MASIICVLNGALLAPAPAPTFFPFPLSFALYPLPLPLFLRVSVNTCCCPPIQGIDVSESGAMRVMRGPDSITLIIERFSSSQKGEYICLATNERGSREGITRIEGTHNVLRGKVN